MSILLSAILTLSFSILPQTRSQHDALIGVEKVCVTVDLRNYNPRLDIANIELQDEIEKRLKLKGIRVDGWPCSAGTPELRLKAWVKTETFSLVLQLREEVILKRTPAKKQYASTWENGPTTDMLEDGLKSILFTLNNLVDEFISRYYEVNPKK